jgi:5-methylcytosine-specific restriction endonuclease McrA
MGKGTCIADGCEKPRRGRQVLCSGHYIEDRMMRNLLAGNPCKMAACTLGSWCTALCKKHYDARNYALNEEKIRARAAIAYEADKPRALENARAWAVRNPEKKLAAGKRWRDANPEKCRAYVDNRRAYRVGANRSKIEERDIRRMLERQDGRCFYCSVPVRGRHEIEHLVPLSRGGRHSIGNIVASCRFCNRSKGAKTVMEFRLYRQAKMLVDP